jgi:tRNA(fMet)-specific endonuclease VapC
VSYLLDTDHISILQRGSGAEFLCLSQRIAQQPPGSIAFSIISVHEQLVGCHGYLSRARSTADLIRGYQLLQQVFCSFQIAPILEFDGAASIVYDDLESRNLRVGRMDLRIAAIAMSRNLILLTRNRADFGKIAGLTIEDWTV